MNLLKQYQNIYDNNVVLMYKGEITFDLVTSIIKTLEERIADLERDRVVKKKFYSAATECLQNLYHHMDAVSEDTNQMDICDSKSVFLLVTVRKKFYNITTGNFILSDKINIIKSKLDNINQLDKKGLRELYKKILCNVEFSDKGTAGLGFVEIARKTGQKLSYEFHQVNDEYTYFTLQVRIPIIEKKLTKAFYV